MLSRITDALDVSLMEFFRFSEMENEQKVESIVLFLRDQDGRLVEKNYNGFEKHS